MGVLLYVIDVFMCCRLEELPLAGEEFRERVAVFSGISSSCLVNVKYSSLRVKTLEAVNSLTMALKGMACLFKGADTYTYMGLWGLKPPSQFLALYSEFLCVIM